ncbi:hypothetical protein DITRI_Ditri12bG0052100 [Diplodiscus trichospermus]
MPQSRITAHSSTISGRLCMPLPVGRYCLEGLLIMLLFLQAILLKLHEFNFPKFSVVEGKAKWQDIKKNILDIIQRPQLINIQTNSHYKRRHICETKPAEGYLKSNVDSSAKGQLRLASIGGMFRDHEANVKLVISKSVGVADFNLAKS